MIAKKVLTADLVIAGAGPVGMVTALFAHHEAINVHWLSPKPAPHDTRLLALSPRTVHYLKRLGVWARITKKNHSVIRKVVIRQASQDIITLDADDYNLPAVGYAIPMSILMQALQDELDHQGVALNHGWSVDSWSETSVDAPILCQLSNAKKQHKFVEANALIMASGSPNINQSAKTANSHGYLNKLTAWQEAGITPWSWLLPKNNSSSISDYPYSLTCQMASVRHPKLNSSIATECFMPDGVVALIPGLAGSFKAIVLKDSADIAANEEPSVHKFNLCLAEAMSISIDDFQVEGAIQTYQPKLTYRQNLVEGKVAWIGNAAHTLSPVGGQGLNLGLHESWTLMSMLANQGLSENTSSINPLSRAHTLKQFAAIQKNETFSTLSATHWLTTAHNLSPAFLGAASQLAKHVPLLSRAIGARLMFGSRAWLTGILR